MNIMLEKSDELAALKRRGQEIISLCRAEKRGFTQRERTDLDRIERQVADVQAEIDRMNRDGGGSNRANPNSNAIGMSDREADRYSIVTAIRNVVEGNFAGTFEHEVSQAAARQLGRSPRGFIVPEDILRRELRTTGGATQLVGTTSLGGNLVATDLSSSIIDLLRNRLVVQALGATVMTGLVGNTSIPAVTGDPASYWVVEDTDVTMSNFSVAQIALTPHTVGAAVALSRRFLIQSVTSAEAFVRGELARVLALAIDKAALSGTGTGEPFGVAHVTGVNACPMSSVTNANANPTYAVLCSFEKECAIDNADFGAVAWAINPAMRAFCKITPKTTSITAGMLMEPDGTIAGYRSLVSNQVRSDLNVKAPGASEAFFGNWQQMLLAFWSGVDITVDTATQALSGTVRVVAHQDCDVGLRHAGAFAYASDIDFD